MSQFRAIAGILAKAGYDAANVAVTMFSANPALNTNDANAGNSFRVVCDVAASSRTQIRATIQPGTVNSLTITHASIGKWAGDANYPDTTATPIELTFGGVSGFAGATTAQTSDWVDISSLSFAPGDKVVVIYDIIASGDNLTASQRYNNAATNATTYFQSMESWNLISTVGKGFNPIATTNYGIASVETKGALSGGGGGGGGGGESGTVPMSLSDARFAGNTVGGAGPFAAGTQANKDWNNNPGYANGNQCFIWNGDGSDVLNISQCRVDWREGPRIGAGSTPTATLNIDECFINCVGKGEDHADGIQAYSPGGQALVNITNSCLRSYSDAEAVSVYGAGFIGSSGFFWADDFQGEVRMTNVIIWGGGRGVSIYADSGTTRVSFDHVYFVAPEGGWPSFDFDIKSTGGTLIIDRWEEVREATIVDGVLVPGDLIPSP